MEKEAQSSETLRKRIDFQNRIWGRGNVLNERLQKVFVWWRTGKINKITFLFLLLVCVTNVIFVFPALNRNFDTAFPSSAIRNAAFILSRVGIGTPDQFYSLLVKVSLLVAPASCYLFVRKIALKHDVVALLSTLLFILPNPLVPDGLPLVHALLNGDGAHVFAFSFIPLFLLYVQAFLKTGNVVWGLISCFGTAGIAIFSPFAFFNLLLFFLVMTIGEGFMGALRIKIGRILFIIFTSFGLSFFWYYPNIIAKIIFLDYIRTTVLQLWSVFPIFIPALPLLGALSFLIFDRREKLNPLFIALFLFIIYLVLIWFSESVHTSGVFTPERYRVEFSFVVSFLSSLAVVLIGESLVRNYLLTLKNRWALFISAAFVSSFLAVFLLNALLTIPRIHEKIGRQAIVNQYAGGVGSISRDLSFTDISSVLASIVSVSTLVFLGYLVFRFPSFMMGSQEGQESSLLYE